MPIGKNSINRVAAGLENPDAAPMTPEETATVTVEIEKKIVEATATEPIAEKGEDTAATKVEKQIVKSTAKKPATKKPSAKKATAKKAEKQAAEPAAEEKKPPELIGQAVAAPAPKKRGRKPGTKNKPKIAAPTAPKAKKAATPAKKAEKRADGFTAVAIGAELPVYLL